MLRLSRCYSLASIKFVQNQSTVFRPEYALKCGLEIHTQLKTRNKLFSQSTNSATPLLDTPNSHTSFYDIALPGTQPELNWEAVLFAMKLSLALDSQVNTISQFDRKHYFYGDQPQGYQVTQHYRPFARGGKINLSKELDGIDELSKDISILQLQIEQDTGKSHYTNADKDVVTLVDLNRSNVPLIELVTNPDFSDIKQVRAFIKKYQNLVRHLHISSGDLETGAMRVDVNLSINEFARVELKNLPNTSSIINAIKYEYQRQVGLISKGETSSLMESETRGWTGSSTVKLRSKETTIDYRYMPDPELPYINLAADVISGVKGIMPQLPDDIMKMLMQKPFELSLKDAKILTYNSNQNDMYDHEALRSYYLKTFHEFSKLVDEHSSAKLPTNWIIHEFLGDLNKLRIPLSKAQKILPPVVFAEFLKLLHAETISPTSSKLLLFHILETFKQSKCQDLSIPDFPRLIKEFELHAIDNVDSQELIGLCNDIIVEHTDDAFVRNLVSGKKKTSLKFLIGQGMRRSQGRIKPSEFEKQFKEILNIQW
ncbi:pet112p [Saccharomyces arboricola H-6]|uniref:Glutamyl-tRNA(Gln) amidotransferase subunit B, mitochondrial n=1 Tax=Saccharomyces arboricola (strain H-6 / AS 2.3317 / CBS 10644) TaxID=1160507 RepID=J8PR76_SACAR|nr:pet112p [Saccharomyces arboricola H-6]